MKKFYLIPLALIILFSCKNQTETKETLITFENALEYDENTISFESARFVKLENHEDAFIGENVIMKMVGGKIYLLDNQNQGSLLCFDREGNFINKIGQKGRGPEEYNALFDFSIRNDTAYLLGRSDKSFIYSYLLSGDFINKIEIPQRSANFELLPDKNFLINSQYAYGTENRLFIMSETGDVEKAFLPNKKDSHYDYVEPGYGLSQSEEAILLCEVYNDTIYSFENNELTPQYILDFGPLTNSDIDLTKVFDLDNIENFLALQKRGISLIRKCYETKDYVFITYGRQKEGEKSKGFYFLYNKHEQSVSTLIFEEGSSLAIKFMGFTNQNELVFILYPYGDEIDELKQLYPDLIIPNLTETDNAMLVFCKISNDS